MNSTLLRDEQQDAIDFRKSFLKTRLIVGVVGVLMPPMVVFGAMVVSGKPGFLPSLSDYYYSGTRDWFVGSLWAIGAGLLVYLASRENRADSWISFAAGLLAIGVALLPTKAPRADWSTTSILHVICAGILFALLGVISFRFGRRDGRRDDRTDRWRRVWQFIHIACACTIWIAIVVSVMIASASGGGPAVLIGETVAVLAFGASWFLKGSEIFNMLREEHGKRPLMRLDVKAHSKLKATPT